jgi:hypothetical protein
MKLNGWQRLWVFVCVLYLLVVVVVSAFVFPSWETVGNFDSMVARLHPEERALVVAPGDSGTDSTGGTRIEFPGGHILVIRDGLTEAQQNAVAGAIAQVVESELAKERKSFLMHAILAALIPCALLYGLGWAVAWVRRGFQQ